MKVSREEGLQNSSKAMNSIENWPIYSPEDYGSNCALFWGWERVILVLVRHLLTCLLPGQFFSWSSLPLVHLNAVHPYYCESLKKLHWFSWSCNPSEHSPEFILQGNTWQWRWWELQFIRGVIFSDHSWEFWVPAIYFVSNIYLNQPYRKNKNKIKDIPP